MAETLGSLLEKTRVAKGLTPEQVTVKTRISATFIRAVEADRFDDLPGEVVVRGFLKTYAQLLDLDPTDLLARYDAMGITTVDKSPELISMPLARSPLGPKVALYGVLTLLLALTVTVYWFFGAPPPPMVVEPAPVATASPTEEPPPAEGGTPEGAPEGTPSPTAVPTPEPSAVPVAAADPLKDPTRPHKLTIVASSDSWLKVTVDGTDIREIVLRGEKTVTWYGAEGFSLSIGNVAGVEVYYNDTPFTLPDAPRNILTNLRFPLPEKPATTQP